MELVSMGSTFGLREWRHFRPWMGHISVVDAPHIMIFQLNHSHVLQYMCIVQKAFLPFEELSNGYLLFFDGSMDSWVRPTAHLFTFRT